MTLHSRNSQVACVLGFGPFPGVPENPAAALALQSHGATASGWQIFGTTMSVSYRRCVEQTAALVATMSPAMVLGVGVAVKRTHPSLERYARPVFHPQQPDVDGRTPGWRSRPQQAPRSARLPVDAMAHAAGIGVSNDCGSYVCNGWLYACLGALPEALPVGFLHIPSSGWSVRGVLSMLTAVSVETEAEDV